MAAILGCFTLALLFLALTSADECSPESLPDLDSPRPARSYPSGAWHFSVKGRANSTSPGVFSPLSGNVPKYFSVKLPYTSLPDLEPIRGSFYLGTEERSSAYRTSIPLKRWNPRFHPGDSRNKTFMRGTITGRFNHGSNLLCAKVCFFRGSRITNETRKTCDALLTLRYPPKRSIDSLFVTGEFRSLLPVSDEWYFSPVLLTGVSEQDYEYTKLEVAEKYCGVSPGSSALEDSHANSSICYSGLERLPLNISGSFCGKEKKASCYPFPDANSSSGGSSLVFQELRCHTGGRVSGFLQLKEGGLPPGLGRNALAVEGKWIGDRVCMVACQGDETADPSSRDCSMLASVDFPQVFSIHRRSPVAGNLTSQRKGSDPKFFAPIPFRAAGQMSRFYLSSPHSLSYSYSKVQEAMSQCPASTQRASGDFPSGRYFQDFAFLSSSPRSSVYQISLNERLQDTGFYYMGARDQLVPQVIIGDSEIERKEMKLVNVSFDISFDGDFFAAEGFYDPNTGSACMIGCKTVEPGKSTKATELEGGKDCKILVKMQYPSSSEKPESRKISVTISSLRKSKDELHFKTIKLASYQSMYMAEAIERVWMRNLEIFLAMADLSLVLVGLIFQLLHARSNPKLRPYSSLVMLGVLVLGHMVPLVLNFEALFDRPEEDSRPVSFSGDPSSPGSLLQVKEVGIRLMNMAALLLLLWLLQLVWNSRQQGGDSQASSSAELSTYRDSEESRLLEESQKDFPGTKAPQPQAGVGETSVILVCFPLYALGALATALRQWFLHQSLWSGLKSYAGLTLDLFLLPQALAYSLWGVEARGVSAGFCVGMTIARVLPHAFDIYRSSRPAASMELVRVDYFFADREWDFFSLAWDIAIPCVGIVFAALVMLQQRFGGRFFVPGFVLNKFR